MKNLNFDVSQYDIFEGMTSISTVIGSIEQKSSPRKIIKILYNNDKKKSKYNELKFLQIKSDELGFELEGVSHKIIDDIASGKTHGGIIALCTKRPTEALNTNDEVASAGFYVILEGIEDPYNFAYAVRSLYAAGADGIIIPADRFKDASGLICKASAGTSELIDIYTCDTLSAIDYFKSKNYKIVSAAIRNSESLYEADLKKPLLLIIGGEKRGISNAVLEKSDSIVRIEYGKKFGGSLPASSAATVLGFEVYRQNR